MTMSRQWRAGWRRVVVGGLALGLAGCGDETGSTPGAVSAAITGGVAPMPPAPAPSSAPSPTPSPSPTPTPTPTPTPAPSPTPEPTSSTMSGVVVQAGDSIGSGLGADNWAAIDHLGLPPEVAIRNVSAPGKAMEAGFGNRQAELFTFRSASGPSVLLIQQGTNDLYYGTGAHLTYAAILIPFVAAARAAGFYVVVDTLLPRADRGWTAQMEQQRLAYNALVRRNDAGADAINDLAADTLLGDAVDPATSPYFADAVHPNLAGQQRLAVLDAAVLGPLLYRYARKPG